VGLSSIETEANRISRCVESTAREIASDGSSLASGVPQAIRSRTIGLESMRKEMDDLTSSIQEVCNADDPGGDQKLETLLKINRRLRDIQGVTDAWSLSDSERVQSFKERESTTAASSATGSSSHVSVLSLMEINPKQV
jgi:predicted RND superfamily exporter protein